MSYYNMTWALLITLSLVFQSAGKTAPNVTDPALTARIKQLFQTVLTTESDKEEATAKAEAKEIFAKHGLPTIAEVGEEAAYEFIVLTTTYQQPREFQAQVLAKAKEAAARHDLPPDAVTFYEARLRVEKAKEEASTKAPTNPDLRDEIERLAKTDQAVRQQEGFDRKKMMETDQRNAAALQAIFDKYGVPTYAMVGPGAAGAFVVMVQHQPPQLRLQVLPKLKANVDAGQADPGSYALVYDRSQRDLGRKQLYGEQLECNEGGKLQEAPMEDEAHVNQRRAELGLMRVELYAWLVEQTMPQFCPPAESKK